MMATRNSPTDRSLRYNALLCGLLAASFSKAALSMDQSLTYRVQRVTTPPAVDAAWDSDAWKSIESLPLRNFMGPRPAHFPVVQAKLAYDREAIYVIFHVEDRYVRAVAKEHQGEVWKDSCVEFFFTPSEDVAQGYFNLEMNCGGTMLLHFQQVPRASRRLAKHALSQIQVAHSLPEIVEPEISEPTTWTVSYRLPVAVFREAFPSEFRQPDSGIIWRANFYKCADDSSHPHWLTWSPVLHDEPDFHRPQSFGTLIFE